MRFLLFQQDAEHFHQLQCRDAALGGQLHGGVQVVLQLLQLLLPDQVQILFRHKAALAGHGVEEAVGLQLVVGPLGGDDGDPQVLGQGPDGGQRLSGGELPGNDLGFDLGVDLIVDGLVGGMNG